MKKLFIIIAALLLVTSCTKTSDKSCDRTACNNQESMSVYVESEFAPLKRVVLTQSEMLMSEKFFESRGIEGGLPEGFLEKFYEERENLNQVLLKYGVEVQRPRLLTEKEKELGMIDGGLTDGYGITNFFSRDPFVTIGNHIIELNFCSPYRRLEVLPIRPILQKEAEKSGCLYVGMPQIDISNGLESEAGPYLEGGDILTYGKTVFVGNSGRASNHAGIVWLRNYLAHWGYEVVEVPLKETTLHLDCAMSLVREGLMIVSLEALPGGIPEQLKDWDKIEVSYDAAQQLATNGLPIDENTYITDIVFKDTVGKELEKRGIKVEYVDYEYSRKLEGAFRCSTQPLLRK